MATTLHINSSPCKPIEEDMVESMATVHGFPASPERIGFRDQKATPKRKLSYQTAKASTNLPMGGGCRWERRVLDQQDFPVYVFPAP